MKNFELEMVTSVLIETTTINYLIKVYIAIFTIFYLSCYDIISTIKNKVT